MGDGFLLDFVLNLIEVATKFKVLGFFVLILVGIVCEQNVDLEWLFLGGLESWRVGGDDVEEDGLIDGDLFE